jgi:hypothetical protein
MRSGDGHRCYSQTIRHQAVMLATQMDARGSPRDPVRGSHVALSLVYRRARSPSSTVRLSASRSGLLFAATVHDHQPARLLSSAAAGGRGPKVAVRLRWSVPDQATLSDTAAQESARRAAVLRFSWRVGRAALVRPEPGDLGAACYRLAEHWRWSDRWLFPRSARPQQRLAIAPPRRGDRRGGAINVVSVSGGEQADSFAVHESRHPRSGEISRSSTGRARSRWRIAAGPNAAPAASGPAGCA